VVHLSFARGIGNTSLNIYEDRMTLNWLA